MRYFSYFYVYKDQFVFFRRCNSYTEGTWSGFYVNSCLDSLTLTHSVPSNEMTVRSSRHSKGDNDLDHTLRMVLFFVF